MVPERVLVVDDSETSRALVEYALRRQGLEVQGVASGEEALAGFARSPCDLVLLDVQMPGLDGFETCRRLRLLPGGSDVPVCFLTGSEELSTFEQAVSSGGDDFLTKPVHVAELTTRVHSLLRLGRLTRALATSNADLTRELAWREDLTAVLYHDLKNGVAGLSSVAEALEILPPDAPQVRGLVRALNEATWSLERMVRDLLEVGRAEAGRMPMRPEWTDLGVLVEAAALRVATLRRASADAVLLRIEDVPSRLVDPEVVRRIVENLVDNALRYGKDSGPIEVVLSGREAGVRLEVIDHGPGIPVGQRVSLFQKYGRLDGARSGYGLGLVSCRILVEALGGHISVDDAPGGGARFVVDLA